jgi:hypothetical protein
MALLNAHDKEIQAAAFRAGLRTAEQTLTAGLGVGTIGGAAVGFTLDKSGAIHLTTSWKYIAGAAALLLITAFFAGLRSYLSMAMSGLPPQYTALASKTINSAVSAAQGAADAEVTKLTGQTPDSGETAAIGAATFPVATATATSGSATVVSAGIPVTPAQIPTQAPSVTTIQSGSAAESTSPAQ